MNLTYRMKKNFQLMTENKIELTPRQIYRREYYQKNKERAKQQIRARYEAKKDELLDYQKQYRKDNRERITLRDRKKRQERLLKAIELLGGVCSDCFVEYDPCVYDFHHVNPKEKDFTIGENMLVGEERFFTEINKCVLLCANCHRLKHKEIDGRKI